MKDRIRTFLLRGGPWKPRPIKERAKDEFQAGCLGVIAAAALMVTFAVLVAIDAEPVFMMIAFLPVYVIPALVPYFILRFLVLLSPWVKEARYRALVALFLVALFSVLGMFVGPPILFGFLDS